MQEDQDPTGTETDGPDQITDVNLKGLLPARDAPKPPRKPRKRRKKRKFDITSEVFDFVPPIPEGDFEQLPLKTQDEMRTGQYNIWKRYHGRDKN